MKVVLRLRQEKYSKTSVICYLRRNSSKTEDAAPTHVRNERASKKTKLADEIKGLSLNHMFALFPTRSLFVMLAMNLLGVTLKINSCPLGNS